MHNVDYLADGTNDNFDDKVRAHAAPFAEQLLSLRDSLQAEYWDLHDEISKTMFSGHQAQLRAMKKLGQLAGACHAIGEAYSAINTARCI